MFITEDIKYVGVNDHEVDLFEGQYVVPHGMSYNSYIILDREIAVLDTVDARFGAEWLNNIKTLLNGKSPDYLIVQHMEPDHSANIVNFMTAFPKATIVSSQKAFMMMQNFFGTDFSDRCIIVAEGNTLPLGKHELHFVGAPMVHWPEVLVTYDAYSKVLFSADGFGKFGALDVDEEWANEARRYYIGIVGKYGVQVQALLKKAAGLDIQTICPLHGPILNENLGYYLNLYKIWSSYSVESDGILIAYTSVYGHTKEAVELLAKKLVEKGCPEVSVKDLARCNMAEAVADAFKFGKIVLATTTYNADIFPFMREFINHLTERNFQNKHIAFIENGSWAPMATRVMKGMLEPCKNLTYSENPVKILSALNAESTEQLEKLACELCQDYIARSEEADKNDLKALFNIGYGLYVVTSRDGDKDNGLIVNTVTQLTNSPNRIGVAINKANLSHDIIKKTGVMNINCISVEAPFSLFEYFGFHSGRDVDKFGGWKQPLRSDNGVIFLPRYINSFMSLKVERYIDLDTHGMFVCTVTESRVIAPVETMTYSYYQQHVKPHPETEGKKGWVCKVCGYVYEGENLPEDYVCPLCKHGASDFEKL